MSVHPHPTPQQVRRGNGSEGIFASHALAAYNDGHNVIPVIPTTNTKFPPRGVVWKHLQTERQSEREVRDLIQRFPRHGLALVCGYGGRPIMDVEWDDEEGRREYRRILHQFDLPPLPISFDARRGPHHLGYTRDVHPGFKPVHGVDVLGKGNIVVIPPTLRRRWRDENGLRAVTLFPKEWESYFSLNQHRRRETTLDISLLPSSPLTSVEDSRGITRSLLSSTFTKSLDDSRGITGTPSLPVVSLGKRLSLDAYAAIAASPDLFQAVCARLNIRSKGLGKAFLCPLPGHDEDRASASLWLSPTTGRLLLRDWHHLGVKEWLSIGEVAHAQARGMVVSLPDATNATWILRVLVESGIVRPHPLPRYRKLPADYVTQGRIVYAGFKFLLRCKWRYELGMAAPFTTPFASVWCGIGERQVGEGLLHLLDDGYLIEDGHDPHGTPLYRLAEA